MLVSVEKMLMSAEIKGCDTWFLYFFDLLWVRCNCAKFHQCRICVTDFYICEQPRKGPSWIGLNYDFQSKTNCSEKCLSGSLDLVEKTTWVTKRDIARQHEYNTRQQETTRVQQEKIRHNTSTIKHNTSKTQINTSTK